MNARIAVFLLLAAASVAEAQPRLRLDVGLVSGTVDAAAARREGVGERGYGVLLGAGLGHSGFIAGFDATFELIEDRAIFTQPTTSGVVNSSTAVYDFTLYAGARGGVGTLDGRPLAAGLTAGYSNAFGLRRIDSCPDCFEERLHLKDGLYLEPGIAVGMARRWWLGASFRVYLASDFRYMVVLRATKAF